VEIRSAANAVLRSAYVWGYAEASNRAFENAVEGAARNRENLPEAPAIGKLTDKQIQTLKQQRLSRKEKLLAKLTQKEDPQSDSAPVDAQARVLKDTIRRIARSNDSSKFRIELDAIPEETDADLSEIGTDMIQAKSDGNEVYETAKEGSLGSIMQRNVARATTVRDTFEVAQEVPSLPIHGTAQIHAMQAEAVDLEVYRL
jgi:hypothetical protein